MSDDPITFPAPEPFYPEAQPEAQADTEQAPEPTTKPPSRRPKRTNGGGYQPFSW